MAAHPPAVARLIEALQRLPGIGPKTAQRLAFHLLKQPTASVQDWERYEWTYVCNADGYAQQHRDEPGVELLRERAEAGRKRRLLAAADGETLGFAVVVWRR